MISTKLPAAFFLYFILNYVNGQTLNHLWLFGSSNQGIVFDKISHEPSIINDKYPFQGICETAVITDPSTGELLFYTDGISIVDQTNKVMPNGDGLTANYACNQAVAVCPMPGRCGKYYVFANSGEVLFQNPGSISYSIVDINAQGNGTVNQPLGDVVEFKSEFLEENTSEAMTIIPNVIQNFYFLLIPQVESDKIKVYKIDESGIIYHSEFSTGVNFIATTAIKFNNQNNKLVILSYIENFPVIVGDFNINTAEFSNILKVPGTPMGSDNSFFYGIHSCEWSPDNSKLYLSKYRFLTPASGGKIFQYDFKNPGNEPVEVFPVTASADWGINSMCKGMKLGPDNKIYFLYDKAGITDNRTIGVIEDPDNEGINCNVNSSGFNFGANSGAGNFFSTSVKGEISYLKANNDFPDCINKDVTIFDFISNDSITITGIEKKIIKTSFGSSRLLNDFEIEYTPSSENIDSDTIFYSISHKECNIRPDTAFLVVCFDTICKNQFTKDKPQGDTSICLKNETYSTYSIESKSNEIFEWILSFPTDTIGYIKNIDNNNITVIWEKEGSAKLSAKKLLEENSDCFLFYDSLDISIVKETKLNAGKDTSICSGSFLSLQATGAKNYHWKPINFFESTISVAPKSDTKYILTSSDICKIDDTVDVMVILLPDNYLKEQVIVTCLTEDSTIQIENPGNYKSYLWNFNNKSLPFMSISKDDLQDDELLVTLEVQDLMGCKGKDSIKVISDCIADFYIPTAFSPNGDGVNEKLEIFGGKFHAFEIKIYNRWGELIFFSNNSKIFWDGYYKGEIVQSGLYPWVISYKKRNALESEIRTGKVCLVR